MTTPQRGPAAAWARGGRGPAPVPRGPAARPRAGPRPPGARQARAASRVPASGVARPDCSRRPRRWEGSAAPGGGRRTVTWGVLPWCPPPTGAARAASPVEELALLRRELGLGEDALGLQLAE